MSRDQPVKAPRYALESRPPGAATVAPRRCNDVTGDVIVHKVPDDQVKPPPRAASGERGGKIEPTVSQQRILTTPEEKTRDTDERGVSSVATSQQNQSEQSTPGNTGVDNSSKASDDAIKYQTSASSTTEPRPPAPRQSPWEKPERAKPEPETTSSADKPSDNVKREPASAGRVETTVVDTEAKLAAQSEPVRGRQPSTVETHQSDEMKPKPVPPVHGARATVRRAYREHQDVFSRVKSDPVK